MSDTRLVVALIRSLIENLSRTPRADWTSLSMILEFDGTWCNGTYGYAYGAETEAISVKPRLIEPALDKYLADLYATAPYPVKMLVQYDRLTHRYEITFEDADTSRWQVTPANIDTMREELRPNLDGATRQLMMSTSEADHIELTVAEAIAAVQSGDRDRVTHAYSELALLKTDDVFAELFLVIDDLQNDHTSAELRKRIPNGQAILDAVKLQDLPALLLAVGSDQPERLFATLMVTAAIMKDAAVPA